MKLEDIREDLERELSERGLGLVWKPDKSLKPEEMIVFGAEQAPDSGDKPLVTGFAKGGNSPDADVNGKMELFLQALEAAGIPRASLHSYFWRTGRGKIWPTFVARLTQEAFKSLEAPHVIHPAK